MAAEAQAAQASPRRAAMAREAAAVPTTFGSPSASSARRVSAGAAESRGSDGALLKSVRKSKVRTASTLAAVSVAGAATAVTMLVNNLSGGAEVKTDPTAAGEPAAINAEKVNADVPEVKGKSSMEIGVPSAKQKKVEAASARLRRAPCLAAMKSRTSISPPATASCPTSGCATSARKTIDSAPTPPSPSRR
ncbi:hypothetical protein [Brevibacterium sp. JSBI002]|uniref:hypothetical protein n=1 Tax=Brevibacterium sp. JSBI002 TaxID=2886045 RepID=UPI00222F1453|nr:hypothetical protein [Brevibacterium sp. JSBI002]UZD62145.1 hypothetical protein LJ362_16035 [Brevibacterium sp. JSBI002]